MKMLRDDNKSLSARFAFAADGLAQAAKEATPTIYAAVKRHLAPKGAVNPKIEVTIPTGNTVEGEYEVSVDTTTAYGRLVYAFRLPMKTGAPIITEASILAAFDAAYEAQKTSPVEIKASVDSYQVDLSTVTARRENGLVIYSSEALPEWSYVVTMDSLKDQKNHTQIASQVVHTIQAHILASVGKACSFKDATFSLPPVQASEVKAAVVPATDEQMYGQPIPKTAAEINAVLTNHNMLVHGKNKQATEELAFDEQKYLFQASVRRTALPAIEAHVRRVLGGVSAQVLDEDFSKLAKKNSGQAMGKFYASIRYQSNTGMESVELEIPFENGAVVANKIVKSAKQVKVEAEQAEALKILTAEQAKQQFEEYQKRQAVHAEEILASGLALNASDMGMGSNPYHQPAMRIPVLKALLSDDVKPGDKIRVQSFVYLVAESDYNSVDAEHSCHYMLHLTDEVPKESMATMGVWGSI